eukprot:7382743-Prymnesium_polylepis.1
MVWARARRCRRTPPDHSRHATELTLVSVSGVRAPRTTRHDNRHVEIDCGLFVDRSAAGLIQAVRNPHVSKDRRKAFVQPPHRRAHEPTHTRVRTQKAVEDGRASECEHGHLDSVDQQERVHQRDGGARHRAREPVVLLLAARLESLVRAVMRSRREQQPKRDSRQHHEVGEPGEYIRPASQIARDGGLRSALGGGHDQLPRDRRDGVTHGQLNAIKVNRQLARQRMQPTHGDAPRWDEAVR